ncbi:hypothetical protein [Arthrobacter sp. M4]|uniref:hypothetical protein n=1 Tax=Arthrobacter sp. M4 TaxID=218160 RepID=UPI001CDB79C0|nr:hypothetical protein [Arthrobacter sp. M4]MCA4132200.1 hypothetical protein [Arthrobacter sp. M4]
MEIFGIAVIVLVIAVVSATAAALRGDGRGHTPPEVSERPWSALDLPSTAYSVHRIF